MTENENNQGPQSEGAETTGTTPPEGNQTPEAESGTTESTQAPTPESADLPSVSENEGSAVPSDAPASGGPAETTGSDAPASDAATPPQTETTSDDSAEAPSTEPSAPAAPEGTTAASGDVVPVVETPASPEELAATAAAVAAKAEADRIEAEKKAAEEAERLEAIRPVWQELSERKESRDPFKAKVTGTNRGGVVAEYNGVEIFIPQSHWSLERSSDVDPTIVGSEFEMTVLEITQFETDARRVTGSRRSLLRKELIESLAPGLRLKGRVSSLTDFGAFVDLGGIDGLLHVTEISHARSAAPKDLLKKGEEIEVIVKKVEKGGKRISLGRKELLDSPWKGVAEKYAPDSLVTGKVVSLTDIGAFIQLEPGVDGLLRPREMSWTKRVGAASDILSVGQQVEVMITSVNEEDERIGLSLKRTGENPWDAIVEKFSDAEATWEASVVEVSNKGAVVSVEDIEGFLPRGRMGRESSKLTELNPGDKLTVNVIEVDPKRPSLIFSLPGAGGSGGGSRGGGGDRFEGEGRRSGGGSGGGGGRRGGGRKDRDFQASKAVPSNEMKSSQTVSNFSLGEMLESVLKEKLGVEEEEKKSEVAAPSTPAKEETSNPTPVAAPSTAAETSLESENPTADVAESASNVEAAESEAENADSGVASEAVDGEDNVKTSSAAESSNSGSDGDDTPPVGTDTASSD